MENGKEDERTELRIDSLEHDDELTDFTAADCELAGREARGSRSGRGT